MTKGQTTTGSVVESVTNIMVGIGIAFASQIIIFSFYGPQVPLSLNAKITAWFTAVSLVRSFVIRRCFNRFTYRHD